MKTLKELYRELKTVQIKLVKTNTACIKELDDYSKTITENLKGWQTH